LSCFERARKRLNCRALRLALWAWTKLAKVIKRINARGVPVVPENLNGIPADKFRPAGL
jgi:hypothetical protein